MKRDGKHPIFEDTPTLGPVVPLHCVEEALFVRKMVVLVQARVHPKPRRVLADVRRALLRVLCQGRELAGELLFEPGSPDEVALGEISFLLHLEPPPVFEH